MCGITGWIDYNQNLLKKRDTIERMTKTLEKRGPDDTNTWVREHVSFGHKRLVVVDPSGGIQPMTRDKKENSYTICYNGELYNTEDIRKELLKRGYTFNGHSDTEVLLLSYVEWREKCVEHFNGIFAFAIWDEEQQSLFMARDRLGVKPLFYRVYRGGLQFASELKAILAHEDVEVEITYDGLAEVLGLGPSHTPGHGIFKGIDELRAAHALTFSREGLNIWRYWNVKSEKHTDSLEETAEHVRELFQDAVTRQLVSDVPVCTFLSGGIDSSAITAIAANAFREQGQSLHTYSIDYEDNEKFFKASEFQPNSDGVYIKKMSDEFKTIHHSCVINNEELAHYLEESVLVRDIPGMADIDSSLLWFCKEIKKDFVVGLSGECADEIFGGYPWFHKTHALSSDNFPWMRSVDARVDLLKDEWQKKLSLKEYVKNGYEQSIKEVPALDGESEEEANRRNLFYLNMIWFMPTLLDRKDRMSMGASLEVRVPFADHRLVEYVWNIPWEMKTAGGYEKGILRKALEGVLPNEVLYRKKSPYPKTHNPHYTNIVQKWLKDILKDSNSPLYELFNAEKLKAIADSKGKEFSVPWFGQLMTGPQLLAHLCQIHVWFENYNIKIVK
jgi:asparagine synthase (glutamine-hydrolysing)